VWKVLFPAKSFQKRGGGAIKGRDYFLHCLAHPQLDPYFSFTDASRYEASGLWRDVDPARVLSEPDAGTFDLFFISGRNWKYVPKRLDGPVLNLLQSVLECREGAPEFRYLKRSALRICVSDAVAGASAPYRNGDAVVIPNGIPLDLFAPAAQEGGAPVLIWARKDEAFGVCLQDELERRGLPAELLTRYLPREEWARRLAAAPVFVGLPHEEEGFFLPALEAMACGAAVVCADAVGNRAFCGDGETCLAPPRGGLEAHADAVERLVRDGALRKRLRANGLERARAFSLEAERERFYALLEERVFPELA
jgi:glycosyltransferase involved in cell wall biosynthesis